MKYLILSAAIVALLTAASVPAFATLYHFVPSDPDLNELTHQEAYRWGINLTLGENENICAAHLFFDNIYDWTCEPNVLYISLLNNKPGSPFSALKIFTDNEVKPNYFDYWTWGKTDLITYTNMSTHPQDITYNFTASQLTALQNFLSDGNCAIAIDPDCHFYNCGISLDIETCILQPPSHIVPEPSTLMLAAAGLAATAAGLLRRFRRQ
jgi:hypothetical protein